MLKPSKQRERTMSEQNEDEADDLELERDVAREIEDAFATVTYPGDDRLVSNPDYYESDDVIKAFRGKHWRDISLDVLVDNQLNLGLLSPEGFYFYLPRFLVAALLHADEVGVLWETVFYTLTPPESEGKDMEWLLKVASLLDSRQKAAVRRFVELWVQTESGSSDYRERALPFWQRVAANAGE